MRHIANQCQCYRILRLAWRYWRLPLQLTIHTCDGCPFWVLILGLLRLAMAVIPWLLKLGVQHSFEWYQIGLLVLIYLLGLVPGARSALFCWGIISIGVFREDHFWFLFLTILSIKASVGMAIAEAYDLEYRHLYLADTILIPNMLASVTSLALAMVLTIVMTPILIAGKITEWTSRAFWLAVPVLSYRRLALISVQMVRKEVTNVGRERN